MRRIKRLWWIGLAIVVLGVGGWWWLSGRQGQGAGNDLFRRTAVVQRGDLIVSISASGTVDPIEKVDVKSKASGEIIELPIQEGDHVKKGDLIARLDREYAQNDYDQAQADYAVAEVTARQRDRELQRLQALYDQKLSSESELDNARLAYDQANAQLLRAKSALSTTKQRLDDTEIRSPIDGIILSRPVEVGQIISSGTTTVTGGTLLCTVANMKQVHIVTSVDETDIGKVTAGMPAKITPDAFPERRLHGTVERIAPQSKVVQNVTVFEVTVLVDNAENLLKAGMNTTVEVVTAESDSTLLIPVKAVEWKQRSELTMRNDSSGARHRFAADSNAGSMPAARGGRSPDEGKRDSSTRFAGSAGGSGRSHNGAVPAVQVVRDGVPVWVPVRTGLSNVDDMEILAGVAEGDTVVYSIVSGAMQARAEVRDRMMNMQGMGLRRTN
ncbi:MAG: efflux RND transporter periplasmic adaptor subunit [Candidatus Zixiibacteriota bacterium]